MEIGFLQVHIPLRQCTGLEFGGNRELRGEYCEHHGCEYRFGRFHGFLPPESNRSQARLNHAVAAGAFMGNGDTLDAAARSGLPAVGASAKAG
jgi:hypothetical protein